MKLSIIIINHNAGDLLIKCLNSLEPVVHQNPVETEVFVVDNDSWDGAVDKIQSEKKWVKLLVNQENFGFSRAGNQAIRQCKGEYILLLNPDTIIPKGTLDAMIKFMDDNRSVGVSTCKVELADGRLDQACHRGFPAPWSSFAYFSGLSKLFPKSRIFGGYHLTWLPLDQSHEIDAPSGCFYLVRRKSIDKVGFLDEDYFLYGEDVDWSYRIKKAGWKIFYYPGVKIIHYKGISSGIKSHTSTLSNAKEDTRRLAINSFYDAMWLFYRKHLEKDYPFFITWVIYLSIWFKRRLSLFAKHV
ncbi:MAG: glycosyltransferase family 2 protein [bacterium]|nr:glycosyltransferase family 2 protein [candidate division WOR-3 bacterium]MDH5684470.1 glycosyltransferase family 2 protein [candidate division WOR-3 bacterium]